MSGMSGMDCSQQIEKTVGPQHRTTLNKRENVTLHRTRLAMHFMQSCRAAQHSFVWTQLLIAGLTGKRQTMPAECQQSLDRKAHHWSSAMHLLNCRLNSIISELTQSPTHSHRLYLRFCLQMLFCPVFCEGLATRHRYRPVPRRHRSNRLPTIFHCLWVCLRFQTSCFWHRYHFHKWEIEYYLYRSQFACSNKLETIRTGRASTGEDWQVGTRLITITNNNNNKHTHFFSLLPAPVSRNPLANGLLSIFNRVIFRTKTISLSHQLSENELKYWKYLFVLICSDCNKFGLFEHVCPECTVWQFQEVVGSD